MVARAIGLLILAVFALYFFATIAGYRVNVPLPPLWIVLCLIAAAAGYSVWGWRKRKAKFTEAASLLGLERIDGKLKPEDQEFSNLRLFSKGHYKSMNNVLRGVNEWFFDYSFQRHSRKGATVYTVALFKLTRGELPEFELHPVGFLSKIAVAFGGQDIGFEDDPDFSKSFRLKGEDEKGIRELFDLLLRSELKAHPQWSFAGWSSWLAVYYRRTLPAGKIFDFFNEARTIARSFERSARRLR
jgi:hypothetical protein